MDNHMSGRMDYHMKKADREKFWRVAVLFWRSRGILPPGRDKTKSLSVFMRGFQNDLTEDLRRKAEQVVKTFFLPYLGIKPDFSFVQSPGPTHTYETAMILIGNIKMQMEELLK